MIIFLFLSVAVACHLAAVLMVRRTAPDAPVKRMVVRYLPIALISSVMSCFLFSAIVCIWNGHMDPFMLVSFIILFPASYGIAIAVGVPFIWIITSRTEERNIF